MRAVVAGRGPCREISDDLRAEGVDVVAIVPRGAPADAAVRGDIDPLAGELVMLLASAQLLVVDAASESLTAPLVALCDRLGVRIVARCGRDSDKQLATAFGLRWVELTASAREILDPRPPSAESGHRRGRVVVVWGPAGAPGRSTVAVGLAAELARIGRRVGLVDADSHAPSVALAMGIADEGPGFAAACRQAERGGLTVGELARVATPVHGIEVLTGINRPARWPELGSERVKAALEVSRDWVDAVVVDVAASLELDEEIVSDLDGPRRNAATLGALSAADAVVAVLAADPVGVSRFIRAYPDLRAAIGHTPVRVLANKTRPGVLGVDPRGQVKRTLERYAGVRDVWFAPADPRAADAALLRAEPVPRVAGRSPLTAALRRFAVEAVDSPSGADGRASASERGAPARRRRGTRAA